MTSQEPSQAPSQEKLNRLFWHSRRGMLELDLLLVPFVQEAYPTLAEDDQARYEAFITGEDQDLFNVLMQSVPPANDDVARIVRLILDHAGKVKTA
ncbi:succinate dehydrogenase assembly factor 2 [Salinispirillum sp. LH 10-3-1]|uniref:FAD assembly factor SdhE n=1 Tax=Salinispirillum sp. LH 10-3-1 TaxID=2952525 RepID=A0AB38YDJ4_9GAMM